MPGEDVQRSLAGLHKQEQDAHDMLQTRASPIAHLPDCLDCDYIKVAQLHPPVTKW